MREINGISIVVATKGRVKLLEELLIGISTARKVYAKPCETILVDDSNAEEQNAIAELCNKYDAVLEKYTNTVAMKRNHGVEIAKYDLILFLDSDCNPVPEILNLHEQCYESEKTGAVAGPLEFVGEENSFWKCVRLTPYLICFKMPYWGRTVPWGATANFSVLKSVYMEIGGFSSDFPNKPGGEDVDLGLMITKAGYEILSAPEAIVYHAKETWSQKKPMYRRAWYYGAADYYLVNRHPDLVCDSIPRRTMISFWVALSFLILAILKNPLYLLGILVWILSDICIMSLIMTKIGFEKSTFSQQFVVQLLIITNELGYVTNCIRHRKISYIHKQIIYFENQLKGAMTNGHVTFWRTIACFSIVLFLVILAVKLNVL